MKNGDIVKAFSFRTGGTVDFQYRPAVRPFAENSLKLVGDDYDFWSLPATERAAIERRRSAMVVQLSMINRI